MRRFAVASLSPALLALAIASSSTAAHAQHADEHGARSARPVPHAAPAAALAHGEGAGHDAPHAHAAHHEHDEKAPPGAINWWHGLIGAREGVEPGLLWRTPEEPAPFLASMLNFGVLVALLVKFGKKPLSDILVKRKSTILREIEEAQRLKKAAEARLEGFEKQTAQMEAELEKLRVEFREQGERDRARIVHEANETRVRMRKDAEMLLEQEMKQLRYELMRDVVDEAVKIASDTLTNRLTGADHDRFAEGFLSELTTKGSLVGSTPRASERPSSTNRGGLS